MTSTLTKRFAMLLTVAALFSFASCDKIPPVNMGGGGKKTILQTVSSDGRFNFLAVAVARAGLSETLNDKDASLTLFAPTDDAFKAAGFASIDAVANAPADVLKNILLYHALGSEVKAAQVPAGANTPVTSVQGAALYVTRNASNKVFVNGVAVIQKDLDAKNGVIHVINRVLIPPSGTIVDAAIGNPNLSFLVAAVLKASTGSTNVAAVLSSAGPFTVFAPTNDAFKKAGFATIDAINAADPNTLTSILTYHVIAGRIFSSDLTEDAKPQTLNGGKVTISLAGGPTVKGNSNSTASKIIATDIVTSNAVVHVIDQVLLP